MSPIPPPGATSPSDTPSTLTLVRVPGGNGSAAGGGGPTYVYLGVFLLLLAFFILLNAVSHFHDQKVGAVLRSVDNAFSTPGAGGRGGKASGWEATAAELRQLGDLVRTRLPLDKVEVALTDDGALVLILTQAELFTQDGTRIRADRVALLDRMAGVLRHRPDGPSVTAELLFATKDSTDTTPLVNRAGTLARALVANGAPAEALSVGLEPGTAAGQMRLIFTISGGAGR